MVTAEEMLGRLVDANNDRIHAAEQGLPPLRPTSDLGWDAEVVVNWRRIRDEWDGFVAAGGRLPLIDEVIDEHQGNEGPWRAGLMVAKGRPCGVAHRFPVTMEVLGHIPGLRSALWSQLDPGTELPEHRGPNAGVLRYHLGVRCGADAGLRIGDEVVAYADGCSVLFDDTVAHAAWNRGFEPRVTLFCEIERPLPRSLRSRNRAVQVVLSLDPRYRLAPRRAATMDMQLNSGLVG